MSYSFNLHWCSYVFFVAGGLGKSLSGEHGKQTFDKSEGQRIWFLMVFESSPDVLCLQGGNALVLESGSVAACCFRFLKWRLFECLTGRCFQSRCGRAQELRRAGIKDELPKAL